MRKFIVLLITSAMVGAIGLMTVPSAAAAGSAQGKIVSDDPANWTPHVLDGRVLSVVQVADTIILGGAFTQTVNDVRVDPAKTQIPRSNLMAFDASTGEIRTTFAPDANGTVNVVLPAGDGETVYVGGSFTSIAGHPATNLARLRVSDGALVSSFNGGSPTGQVKDLRLSGGRLWVAGAFTHIQGKRQPALATLNPTTGAFDPYMQTTIAGVHNGGYTTVMKIDVNPQGTRLVAIGNFDTLAGVKNHQLFMLDTTGDKAAQANFQTSFYTSACSRSFDSYMRDLDFSPDGSFFVVSTTGAYGGSDSACDETARWNIDQNGTALKPAWVDYTGGDTTYAVEITDSVVYTGGHARWQNNPTAGDKPGAGAVPRPGIAALDPADGLPLSWNPTRTRGVGVFDFLASTQGLWVASDTDRIGNYEYHARIALMPADGKTISAQKPDSLPNDVYQVTSSLSGNGVIARRSFDGQSAGATSSVPGGGANWSNLRGSFMLNGYLYSAWSDGSFSRRTFDGSSYGTVEQVDTSDQLVRLAAWHTDAAAATGMFYDNGRLYYTKSGSSTLYYRYFTEESGVIGGKQLAASTGVSGISFSQVRGMFLAGSKLYWATSDGNLQRIGWSQSAQSGLPSAGTTEVVSGPGTDGVDWSSRDLFVFQDADGDPAAQSPSAEFTSDCASLDCTFDGSGSTAPGASIANYTWDFGDGGTGTGQKSTHTYSASGSYKVTLTVTTTKGVSDAVAKQVIATRTNQAPQATFTSGCDQLVCSFDGSDSSDSDGSIVSYTWGFGDGVTATGKTVSHAYPAAGTHDVTLTVTDNQGATGKKTSTVEVSADTLDFVGADSTNGNRTSHSVKIPNGVQTGDTLLVLFTANTDAVTVTPPSGWTQLEAVDANGIRSRAWGRTATSSDAGSSVTVATSGYAKSDMTVAAYHSSTGTSSIAESTSDSKSSSATSLTTPAVSVTQAKSWVVSYWGAKTVSTPVPAADSVTRTSSQGSGGGAVSATLADSGGAVATGTAGGVTATVGTASSRSAMFSVVLRTN